MAIITTGTHPKLLWPGLAAIWGQIYDQHPPEYVDLYNVETSRRSYEEDVQVTGFPLAQVKAEGEGGSYAGESQGYVSRYLHIAYSLGFIVTYEEQQDDLYMQVGSARSKANAFAMAQTIEVVAAFLYNNAFSTTFFTMPDGAALISASHATVYGSTYSNALTPAADLTEASLEDLVIQIMGMKNDRGLNISALPQSLHIAPSEVFNAQRILKSINQSGTANNDINVLREMNVFPGGAKVNHYFTSPHAWFVRTNIPNGMKMYWRERPSLNMDNDFDTKNSKSLAYMRFSVGATDPRGIFGSNGP